jgi:membrane protein implicated in regulation of membrane protease activity
MRKGDIMAESALAIITHDGCLISLGILGTGGIIIPVILIQAGIINPIVGYAIIGLIVAFLISIASLAVVFALISGRANRHERLTNASDAIVIEQLQPEGRVKFEGENWLAILDPRIPQIPVAIGAHVKVVAIHGLRLIVIPAMGNEQIIPTGKSGIFHQA